MPRLLLECIVYLHVDILRRWVRLQLLITIGPLWMAVWCSSGSVKGLGLKDSVFESPKLLVHL